VVCAGSSRGRLLIEVIMPVAEFALTVFLTHAVRIRAERLNLLDVPNSRSSHAEPTPRGGGIAIAGTVVLLTAIWALLRGETMLVLPLLVAGAAAATVGFLDDRHDVRWQVRLTVHVIAVAVVVVPSALPAQSHHIWLPIVVAPLLILAGSWAVNLFNFMDGIDGIAAIEGAFISFGGFLILLGIGASNCYATPLAICGASCLGFLVWNRPRAKIFMGDVGSGFLGLWLFGLGVLSSACSGVSLWMWVVLWGSFAVDATFTLLRRVATGAKWHEAHRSHAYQHLSRRWGSHGKATLLYAVVNVAWLLPMAWLTVRHANWGPLIALLAWMPLVAGCAAACAGRTDNA
jgi:Fuc2NAc and GlcNAc transferase